MRLVQKRGAASTGVAGPSYRTEAFAATALAAQPIDASSLVRAMGERDPIPGFGDRLSPPALNTHTSFSPPGSIVVDEHGTDLSPKTPLRRQMARKYWQPNNEATSCAIESCSTKFGSWNVFSGRHHCRACGRVVCASCSLGTVYIVSVRTFLFACSLLLLVVSRRRVADAYSLLTPSHGC